MNFDDDMKNNIPKELLDKIKNAIGNWKLEEDEYFAQLYKDHQPEEGCRWFVWHPMYGVFLGLYKELRINRSINPENLNEHIKSLLASLNEMANPDSVIELDDLSNVWAQGCEIRIFSGWSNLNNVRDNHWFWTMANEQDCVDVLKTVRQVDAQDQDLRKLKGNNQFCSFPIMIDESYGSPSLGEDAPIRFGSMNDLRQQFPEIFVPWFPMNPDSSLIMN